MIMSTDRVDALRRLATLLCLACAIHVTACVHTPRAVVPISVQRASSTPRDASVSVDEEYVGPLYLIAAQGLRLPVGKHRITVTREGYFPWDHIVDADRSTIVLAVELVPIPE